MKKHISLLVLSAAALLGGVTGCNQNANNVASSDNSIESSEPIDTRATLTIDPVTGVDVTVKNAAADSKYEPGTEISFTVTTNASFPDNLKISGVKVNGYAATAGKGENTYVLVMPIGGATISVTTTSIGDIDVKNVKDIDATKIPTLAKADYEDKDKVTEFAKKVADIVEAGDATHAKLLRGADFSISNSPINGYEISNTVGYSGNFKPGKGSVYATEDKIKAFVSDCSGSKNNTYKYAVENGYADESKTLYYTRNTSWNSLGTYYYGEGAKADPDQINLYHVVKDDTESIDSKTMIKEKDAASHSTSFAVGSVFASYVFGDGSSSGLVKTNYGGDKLLKIITDVNTVTAEDGKSYTMNIVAFDLDYLDSDMFYKYVYTYTVDGDGFVSKLAVHKYKYEDKNYWDSENKKLTDNAVATSDSYSDFDLIRGYKYGDDEIETTNVEDFKMNDYDVVFEVQNEWSGSFTVSTADLADDDVLTFEVGTQIKSFYYLDYTSGNAVLLPEFKGTADDGFLTLDSSKYYVIGKEGETTLKFDNWFGEIKEIPVKFVQPAPHSIVASLDSSTTTVGASIELTASIGPATADQGIKVELAKDDPTESELVKKEDGKWTITPKKIGISSVVITSTVDPTVTKTLNFTVAGPAILADVKAYLPTVTFVNAYADKSKLDWNDAYNVNFNEDGTGSIAGFYVGWSTTVYGPASFTWTASQDGDKVVIDITQSEAVSNVTVSKITAVNDSSYEMTFTCNSKEYTISIYAGDRIESFSSSSYLEAV